MAIQAKTAGEIECIRRAGRVVRKVIDSCGAHALPGVTTGDLEDIAIDIISSAGGTSPFLGYAPAGHPPFPAWTCISVNDEIVHGIPGKRKLAEGDIVTIDCGVELGGFIADSAWTFGVGAISPEAEKLLKITEESLYLGIAEAVAGASLSNIGNAVQKHAEQHGFGVIRELTGHGVGRKLHEEPSINNYGPRGKGPALPAGLTCAIEPMICQGRRSIQYLDDGWTIVTADHKLSAHFEHTVAIRATGADILTNGA